MAPEDTSGHQWGTSCNKKLKKSPRKNANKSISGVLVKLGNNYCWPEIWFFYQNWWLRPGVCDFWIPREKSLSKMDVLAREVLSEPFRNTIKLFWGPRTLKIEISVKKTSRFTGSNQNFVISASFHDFWHIFIAFVVKSIHLMSCFLNYAVISMSRNEQKTWCAIKITLNRNLLLS